jgi:hypothetical protein
MLLFLMGTLASVPSVAEEVRLAGLTPSDALQPSDDAFSCGHYSVYRLLKFGYGRSETIQFLKDRIGYTILPFGIKLGQPPPVLARELREMGYAVGEQGNATVDRIKDLLWAGIPLVLLINVEVAAGPLSTEPRLHYWVANGYDDSYLYVLDPGSNHQLRITWYDLDLLRYFKGKTAGTYSTDDVPGYGQTSKIAVRTLDLAPIDNAFYWGYVDTLELKFGANRGSIVFFDRPIEGTRVIRKGQRVPLAVLKSPGAGAHLVTTLLVKKPSVSTSSTSTAVEFFHHGFGHYVVSAEADEIAKLDSGFFAGWVRTGELFKVYDTTTPHAAVCRFFTTAFAPKSSHFYTPIDHECAKVKLDPVWQYEKIAFKLALPVNGSCSSGTQSLFRLYNNGKTGAPNHRYTTSPTIRAQMIASGFVPEDNNTACVPD